MALLGKKADLISNHKPSVSISGAMSPDPLKKHKETHTGAMPFQCDVCKKECRRMDYLIMKMRMHTGEKPFQYKVCTKLFKQRGHLSARPLSGTIGDPQIARQLRRRGS